MTALDAQRFRRAFLLHPRAWREQNEAAAVGVLMDAAESSGEARLPFAERLSIYFHAGSAWLEYALGPARNATASLGLGTGIAVAAVYLAAFVVAPVAAQEFVPASMALVGVALVVPWVAAGFLAMSGYGRASRWAVVSAALACLAVGMARLWLPHLPLPSTMTLLFFALSAVVALLGRPRASVTWGALIGVGLFVAAIALASGLFGSFTDWRLWVQSSYFLIFVLSAWFVGLLTAAACGHESVALAGMVYAAPWAILMVAGAGRGGAPAWALFLIVLIWLCASVAVAVTVRVRGSRLRRRTYVR